VPRLPGLSAARARAPGRLLRVTASLRSDVIAICRAIDAGDVQPRDGAARIWLLMAEADYPPELEEFRVFVGMISEMQDHPQHEAAYAEDVRDEARAVIERAGRS
jgi:hypothetical protein